ncbi:peptide MFS transporter [Litorimonas sp. RW-G-Af-16]|uniref:peptide MFS transporter n=1 Tax=Litorimonas sp. RW-G-Af-16 TaxID=3241168 RepID=UPI00390C9141
MRNHPKGLYVLFFAEMWERFSYYGMRALLILYLTKHFLFSDTQAYGIYGAYTTLVYITPVIGGMLADQFLGQRKAVLVGAILLVLGHAGMAIEGEPVLSAADRDGTIMNVFYLSLALIIAGVGFLKANISAIVGELYEKTDERRDGAFTLFYVGINLGAFAGALISGYLGETYGWKYGFGVAGIGMLAGLIVFVWGKPLLNGAGESPNPTLLAKKQFAGLSTEWVIYLSTLLGVAVIWCLISNQGLVQPLLYFSMAAIYIYIVARSVITLPPHPRNRILAALLLISVQVLFWALFEQAGSSLNLYTDREVDRTFLGQEVVASVFQSLNAMYIIVLGPLFAALWVWLGKKGLDPSAPAKFGLGLIQLGLGFLVLVWGANAAGVNMTPVLFIFLIYLLHTTGELCLSPVGLSAMTRLSVPKMVGLVMGAWFLASGAGNFAAAQIAKLTAAGDGGEAQVLEVYSKVGWLGVAVGVGLIIVSPLIKRMMHLDTLEADMAAYYAKEGGDLTMDGDNMVGERMSPTGDPKP